MTNLYQPLVLQLKKILKQRKVSYAKLAKTLGVPESTLKKWFAAKDGSINRLSLVCESLGLNLSQLLQEVERETVQTHTFNKKQQELFLNDPLAFRVFWLLVYERRTAEDVEALLKLTATRLHSYLTKLDRLDLLQLTSKGKVVLPKAFPLRWNWRGDFLERALARWSEVIVKNAYLEQQHETSANQNLTLQYFQLTQQSEFELREDLRNLEEKYARRTIHELLLGDPELRRMGFVCAISKKKFI